MTRNEPLTQILSLTFAYWDQGVSGQKRSTRRRLPGNGHAGNKGVCLLIGRLGLTKEGGRSLEKGQTIGAQRGDRVGPETLVMKDQKRKKGKI